MTSVFSWQKLYQSLPCFIPYSKAKFACYSRCFLPGESQGCGSLVGCHLWVAQSQTRLKQLSANVGTGINGFSFTEKSILG